MKKKEVGFGGVRELAWLSPWFQEFSDASSTPRNPEALIFVSCPPIHDAHGLWPWTLNPASNFRVYGIGYRV